LELVRRQEVRHAGGHFHADGQEQRLPEHRVFLGGRDPCQGVVAGLAQGEEALGGCLFGLLVSALIAPDQVGDRLGGVREHAPFELVEDGLGPSGDLRVVALECRAEGRLGSAAGREQKGGGLLPDREACVTQPGDGVGDFFLRGGGLGKGGRSQGEHERGKSQAQEEGHGTVSYCGKGSNAYSPLPLADGRAALTFDSPLYYTLPVMKNPSPPTMRQPNRPAGRSLARPSHTAGEAQSSTPLCWLLFAHLLLCPLLFWKETTEAFEFNKVALLTLVAILLA